MIIAMMITLNIQLDRNSDVTLDRQLYNHIRAAILSGEMKPGMRVLSTRELSETLKISRSTVVDAYKQLIAEGYLDAKAKSNTFVCLELPASQSGPVPARVTNKLTELGKRLSKTEVIESPVGEDLEIPFYFWRNALEELPLEQWTKNLWKRSRVAQSSLLDWGPRAGSMRLRQAIADLVRQTRGIDCSPAQVITTLGYQQAMDMISRLFIARGDLVAMENPCFMDTRAAIEAYGAELVPIDVDESGLIVEQLAARTRNDIKLLCLTPSHQFPTGTILSMSRRMELLDWSRKANTVILEDDYDSEFRYEGQPIPALAGLDRNSLVVYVGSFSKILYTSFGIGYMVVPENLVELFENMRRLAADPLPAQMQEALADFIEEGHLKRHIKHMKPIYEERRSALIHSLKQHLGHRVTIFGDNAGLHVMARIKSLVPDQILIARCARVGVGLVSTTNCYLENPRRGEFVFGYGNLSPEEIREGIRRLSAIVTHSD
ncbi:MAG: PLP-dependent aminotransferase family protein [Candidatus Melainabacteria bacterium]|nr:MAG: PLP-dependent aminotransferase family protein [Candidatus Melainabacteria bacterium]